jgi:hypothetical protein
VADYAPVYLPGNTFTCITSGAVAGGDLVGVSGNGTVAKLVSLAATTYVGIAAHDAGSGARVAVIAGAVVHDSIADGTVTAGDFVGSTNTANRQVKTIAAVGAANADLGSTYVQATANTAVNNAINTAVAGTRSIVGVALTTAADNALVRWMQR